MKYNTVLFDLDGTLIDTNPLIVESFKHTFSVYFPEMELTLDTIKTFIGPTLHKTFGDYVETEEEIEHMIHTYKAHNLSEENMLKYVTVYDNVIQTLDELKEMGVKMSIVTSKMEDSAEKGMTMFSIDQYFDHLIGYHAVTNHKPDPEGINKAIDLYDGVDGVIMIGDNRSDILAGINAGVDTAGVSWAFKGRENLDALNPTYMLEDMYELVSIVKGE